MTLPAAGLNIGVKFDFIAQNLNSYLQMILAADDISHLSRRSLAFSFYDVLSDSNVALPHPIDQRL